MYYYAKPKEHCKWEKEQEQNCVLTMIQFAVQ